MERWSLKYGLLSVCCGLAACLSALAAAQTVATAKPAPKGWSVSLQPDKVVTGAPIFFRVTPPQSLKSLNGSWLEHAVFFDFDAKSKSWTGIAGTSEEARAGTYLLKLTGTSIRGKEISFQRKIRVTAGKYRSITLTVAKTFTEPDPEVLKRVAEEKTLKAETFRRTAPEREWSGDFRAPVSAPVSDVFGTKRVFNGKAGSVHQGLDYGVPSGTPVHALNRGTVLLARPLFFEGNCVVLDHGQGLLTLYLHLSEIKVKEGDAVATSDLIGVSGGTGRATGPHLHIAVRWQGVYLDPAVLLRLRLQ